MSQEDFIFISAAQPSDILPVPVQRKRRQSSHHTVHLPCVGLGHLVIPHLSKQDHTYQCRHISSDGTKRDIMRGKENTKKHNSTYQKNLPVKRDHQSHRRCDPLAAAEIQVKGKIMPQNTPRCRIETQKRHHFFAGLPKKHSCYENSSHTFQTVTQKGKRTCFFAKGTQSVGGSCISASMLTNIRVMDFPNNV